MMYIIIIANNGVATILISSYYVQLCTEGMGGGEQPIGRNSAVLSNVMIISAETLYAFYIEWIIIVQSHVIFYTN